MRKFTSTWLCFVFLTLVVGNGLKLSFAFETNLTIDLSSGNEENLGDIAATVLLPFDAGYLASVRRTGPAIILAFEEVRARKLLPSHKVNLDFRDSNCSIGLAPYQAVRTIIDTSVNVFFGPSCDFALAPVARLVKYLNTPLLTAGALTTDFTDPKTTNDSEFFLTTRTGFAFKEMVEFLLMYFQR